MRRLALLRARNPGAQTHPHRGWLCTQQARAAQVRKQRWLDARAAARRVRGIFLFDDARAPPALCGLRSQTRGLLPGALPLSWTRMTWRCWRARRLRGAMAAPTLKRTIGAWSPRCGLCYAALRCFVLCCAALTDAENVQPSDDEDAALVAAIFAAAARPAPGCGAAAPRLPGLSSAAVGGAIRPHGAGQSSEEEEEEEEPQPVVAPAPTATRRRAVVRGDTAALPLAVAEEAPRGAEASWPVPRSRAPAAAVRAAPPRRPAARPAPAVALPAWALAPPGQWEEARGLAAAAPPPPPPLPAGATALTVRAALRASAAYCAELTGALDSVRSRRAAVAALRARLTVPPAALALALGARMPGIKQSRGEAAGGTSRFFRAALDAPHAPPASADVTPSWRLAQQRLPMSILARPWSETERTALRCGVQWQLQQAHMAAALAAAGGRALTLQEVRDAADAAPRIGLTGPPLEDGAAPGRRVPGDGRLRYGGALAPAVVAPVAPVAPGLSSEVPAGTPAASLQRVDVSGVDWAAVRALHCPGRGAGECCARWSNFEEPLLNVGPWCAQEDQALRLFASRRGGHAWAEVSEELFQDGVNAGRPKPLRSPAECLRRYQTCLSSKACACALRPWTAEEDARMLALVEQHGAGNWAVVGALLGRTGGQVHHRASRGLAPGKKRGRWSPGEDAALRAAYDAAGGPAWTRVASLVEGRTDVQCRERWANVLNPGLDKSPWRPEEDVALREAVAQLRGDAGQVSWAAVALRLAPRTDSQCCLRWRRAEEAAGQRPKKARKYKSKSKSKKKAGNLGDDAGAHAAAEEPAAGAQKRAGGRPRRAAAPASTLREHGSSSDDGDGEGEGGKWGKRARRRR